MQDFAGERGEWVRTIGEEEKIKRTGGLTCLNIWRGMMGYSVHQTSTTHSTTRRKSLLQQESQPFVPSFCESDV